MIRGDIGCFAVADGMGGHAAGEVASATALAAFDAAITQRAVSETTMLGAIRAANRAVWQRAESEPDKNGMGTTLTAFVTALNHEFIVGHVGDSRLYRLRDGALEQLTHDHTAAQELVDSGQLSKREAQRHPLSSMLHRSIGTRPDVDVDVLRSAAQPRDRYLLCSDGLSGMLDDADIAAIITQEKAQETICAELIEAANLRGGVDNITALLIDVA